MSQFDPQVKRAIEPMVVLAGKAARFATMLLGAVTVVCGAGFLLGLAALSGGPELLWIAVAGAFGALAIGGAVVLRWRVGSIRRHVPELIAELGTLAMGGAGTTRTVFEAFETDEPGGGSSIQFARDLVRFQDDGGHGPARSRRLTAAMSALASVPALAIGAVVISVVFAFFGAVFLVALAL